MKRDWDTIRRIMAKVDALPDECSYIGCDEVCGIDRDTCAYNMRLMIEAGLAAGTVVKTNQDFFVRLNRLTWEGHELLDSIRKDTAWNKIKEIARTKSIDLTVEALKIATTMALKQVMTGG